MLDDVELGAVVVVAVEVEVEAVEAVVVVVLAEVDDEEWFIICWNLWQPPSVNISAAAQARTEIRI